MTATVTIDFLDSLEKSGLLAAPTLEQVRRRRQEQNGAAASGEALAKAMIDERLLTRFQAKQLLGGRHRGFFISDKYKILELLGEGGMGRVLLCEHLLMRRLVAVKLMQGTLDRHASALDRFLREARAAASLHHPNIAQVFDVDRSERGPYLVMEYIDGLDLHRLTAKNGPLPIDRAVNYICQGAAGLQHAHEAGLVHRDVKPLNLMVDRTGVVRLLDLGLARFFEPEKNDKLTQQHDVSAILGTADFIAPEQALESSTADIRADIYSLGLTLYFLLAAKLPYGPGKSIQKLLWHQVREPEPIRSLRPDVPEELAAVLAQMIRKKPEERFSTPAEAARALEPWNSATVAPPTPEEMPPTLPSSYRLGLSPARDKPPGSGSAGELSSDVSTSGGAGAKASSASFTTRPPSAAPSPRQPVGVATPANVAAVPKAPAPEKPPVNSWLEEELASMAGPPGPPLRPPTRPLNRPSPQPRPTSGAMRRLPPWARGVAAVAVFLVVLGGVIRYLWTRDDNAVRAARDTAIQISRSGNRDGDPAPPATPNPAGAIVLNGGGSTFVRPIMEHWAQRFEAERGIRIDYKGVGSGKGIEGVTSKLLDFGCTDAFLNDEQLAAAKGKLLHVPLVLGAVVPTYNLPLAGASASPLRFTGPVLANIYLGRITRWNDPAIAVNNPGLKLPDLAIAPVYRSDSSGTTSIWTDYLAKASGEWKDAVGTGTSVAWPAGTGAEKNDGVADAVSRTVGGIGYVELSYALANGLPCGQVKNSAGAFITPAIDSVTAAATASLKDIPADMRYSLTDAPGAASYPIVGTAWALLYAEQPYGKGKELAEFLLWATTDGQQFVGDFRYGRLPPELTEIIRKSLEQVDSRR